MPGADLQSAGDIYGKGDRVPNIVCGGCGHSVTVPEAYVGRTIKCPTCRDAILVGGAEDWDAGGGSSAAHVPSAGDGARPPLSSPFGGTGGFTLRRIGFLTAIAVGALGVPLAIALAVASMRPSDPSGRSPAGIPTPSPSASAAQAQQARRQAVRDKADYMRDQGFTNSDDEALAQMYDRVKGVADEKEARDRRLGH